MANSSIFIVSPAAPITADPAASQPTLSASVAGVVNNTATYTIDYTSDATLLWAVNCTSALAKNNGSCSESPNLVVPNFNANQSAVWQSSYSNVSIGGYVTNGQIYYTNVCTSTDSACQVMSVYVADTIIANNWNYDVQGAWGILGYGPRSAFWQAYINTQGIAYSSTVLVPVSLALGAYYDSNEITFGSLGSYSTYTSEPVIINANMLGAQPVYDMDRFGFGVTYSDGSAYYNNFTGASSMSAQFTPNFEGMGLPSSLYKQYESLVLNATSLMSTPATCTNGTNGYCVLPGSCSSLAAALDVYSFQVQFANASNYINVPLSAFLFDESGKCGINVVSLPDGQADTSNVVFGANFYMAFFVAQQSTYALVTGQETLTAVEL